MDNSMRSNKDIDLAGSRVLLCGHSGFVGRAVEKALKEKFGAHVLTWENTGGGRPDLTNQTDCHRLFKRSRPDYVINVAGGGGGIHWNGLYPGDVFWVNSQIALNVLKSSVDHKVKKVLSLVTSCAYPEDPIGLYSEETFLQGTPHPSVACHAYAKRNLQIASAMFNKQYGLNAICVCPPTLYGPGLETHPEKSKVVGAMIRRFADAKKEGVKEVTCWGSGGPLREILFIDDATKLITQVFLRYEDPNIPLNIGFQQEISVRFLAELIASEVGYQGEIVWDKTKPDGAYRKLLDNSRMLALLPSFAPTSLQDGLKATVDWYLKEKSNGL